MPRTIQKWSFPGGSVVKNLPAVQETWVQSQGQEDPLEEKMATHSSIFAQKILWKEEPGGLQSKGCKESETTEHTNTSSQVQKVEKPLWSLILLFFRKIKAESLTC